MGMKMWAFFKTKKVLQDLQCKKKRKKEKKKQNSFSKASVDSRLADFQHVFSPQVLIILCQEIMEIKS